MTVSNSSDRLRVSDEDTEDAASARILEDEAAGVRTLYLVCARIAAQRRLSPDARKSLERAVFRAVSDGSIASIARESEVPDLVCDVRGTTSVAVGLDTVVNEHDVIAWLDAQRRAVYKTPSRRAALTPALEKASAKAAVPRPKSSSGPAGSPTSAATAARWGSTHEAFKRAAVSKVVARHEVEPFRSLAEAARWLSDESPKKEGSTDVYKPKACERWLNEAGYGADYFRQTAKDSEANS